MINESFDDFTTSANYSGKGTVSLNPDQTINPYKIKCPITWSGFLNNEKIKIIQNEYSTNTEDFDFIDFPAKYYFVKSQIVKWIDDSLRGLD